jgi:pilus assembly protein Flp/PilA
MVWQAFPCAYHLFATRVLPLRHIQALYNLGAGAGKGCCKGAWAVRVIAWRLWRDRRGASLIDYTLLIGLITLTVLGAVIAIGSWANGMWVNFLSSLGP